VSSGRSEDPSRLLEWLVPEGGARRAQAERVVAFTRATARLGAHSHPGPVEAEREFEDAGRVRAVGMLENLLVHHLRAACDGRSFLPLPPARSGVQAAWDELASLRESTPSLPGVPEPGETALAVSARLLEGLYRLGSDEADLGLWLARLEHARAGAWAGERVFRERLASTPARGQGSRTFPAALGGLIACLLDRGAVREACALLEEHRALGCLASDVHLRRMQLWTRLLVGDLSGAEALRDEGDLRLELPQPLVELRSDWPEVAAILDGREISGQARGLGAFPATGAPQDSRNASGASLLAVFAFGPGRAVELLHLDVAPGLRSQVEPWLRDRDGACSVRSRPEHALVIEASARRLHAGCGATERLPSALGRHARSLVLSPVLDEEGEVAGWVHLEFEHHLVPERARLEQLADSWRLRILRRTDDVGRQANYRSDRVGESRPEFGGWVVPGAAQRLELTLEQPAGDLCAQAFGALARASGLKLRQRRWWGFVHACGQTRFVASGGGSLGDVLAEPGGARGLDRCLATGGVVAFDEPDAHLAIHAHSCSGTVLPLMDGGRVTGLFAVESSRRRDFRSPGTDQLAELADSFALSLSLARFRGWHLERHGFDLFFDSGQPAMREFSERVGAAARSRSPLVLSGPCGAGKRVVARWVQWCSGQGELEVFHGELDGADEERRRELEECLLTRRQTLLIGDVAALPPELQEAVLRSLEVSPKGGLRAQLIVTTSSSLEQEVERGALRPDLAERLNRFQLFVPGLADRRADIPGLARFFAARFAAEEGCVAPQLDADALALLWRQRWPGNLRELEALMYKLVLLHPGEEVGSEVLRSLAKRFKLELRERIPSLRPRRRDLVQALRSTLTSTGRSNKSRAAACLGWDPDTLVARLKGAGLEPEAVVGEEDSWVG
jgi:two-component system nitrogen regulation response regulator NtrX